MPSSAATLRQVQQPQWSAPRRQRHPRQGRRYARRVPGARGAGGHGGGLWRWARACGPAKSESGRRFGAERRHWGGGGVRADGAGRGPLAVATCVGFLPLAVRHLRKFRTLRLLCPGGTLFGGAASFFKMRVPSISPSHRKRAAPSLTFLLHAHPRTSHPSQVGSPCRP